MAAIVLGAVAVLVRISFMVVDDATVAEMLGGAIATLVLPAIVAGLFSLRSASASVKALLVGFALVLLATVSARAGDRGVQLDEATQDQLEALGEVEVTDDQARCIDDELGGEVSLDELMNDPQGGEARRTFVQAVLDCSTGEAGLALLADSFARNMELSVDGQADISEAEGACVVEYILENSDDPARTMAISDQPEDVEVILGSVNACLEDDNLAVFLGEPGAGPQRYGEDDRFDLLADDCRGGDDRACDLLYIRSSLASEYSDIALDCAGRGTTEDGLCTAGLAVAANGIITSADDPDFVAQVDACVDGDMTACDLVYHLAPLGSEAENTGFTCGGRIAIGALPDCRTRFG